MNVQNMDKLLKFDREVCIKLREKQWLIAKETASDGCPIHGSPKGSGGGSPERLRPSPMIKEEEKSSFFEIFFLMKKFRNFRSIQ